MQSLLPGAVVLEGSMILYPSKIIGTLLRGTLTLEVFFDMFGLFMSSFEADNLDVLRVSVCC